LQSDGGSATAHWRRAYPRQDTLDFDRSRKLMSVCCRSGEQHLVFTKGAPESVLPRCTFAIDEEGSASAEMTAALRRDWERIVAEWGGDAALRCVALAYSAVPGNRAKLVLQDEKDLVFLGLLGLQDPPRPEVADAVATCGVAGVRVVMLTGAPPGIHAMDVVFMCRRCTFHVLTNVVF
jgi:magnesium-transporting ATPase (P-type)